MAKITTLEIAAPGAAGTFAPRWDRAGSYRPRVIEFVGPSVLIPVSKSAGARIEFLRSEIYQANKRAEYYRAAFEASKEAPAGADPNEETGALYARIAELESEIAEYKRADFPGADPGPADEIPAAPAASFSVKSEDQAPAPIPDPVIDAVKDPAPHEIQGSTVTIKTKEGKIITMPAGTHRPNLRGGRLIMEKRPRKSSVKKARGPNNEIKGIKMGLRKGVTFTKNPGGIRLSDIKISGPDSPILRYRRFKAESRKPLNPKYTVIVRE